MSIVCLWFAMRKKNNSKNYDYSPELIHVIDNMDNDTDNDSLNDLLFNKRA